MKIRRIRIIIYIFIVLLVYLVPRANVERTSICVYYNLFHILCPTCGGTRAFWSFAKFDFATAYAFNPILTLTLYPFLAFIVLNELYCYIFKKPKSYLEYLIGLCFGGRK